MSEKGQMVDKGVAAVTYLVSEIFGKGVGEKKVSKDSRSGKEKRIIVSTEYKITEIFTHAMGQRYSE